MWALAFGHFSLDPNEERQFKFEFRLLNKKKKDSYTWVNVQSVDMSGLPGMGRLAFIATVEFGLFGFLWRFGFLLGSVLNYSVFTVDVF